VIISISRHRVQIRKTIFPPDKLRDILNNWATHYLESNSSVIKWLLTLVKKQKRELTNCPSSMPTISASWAWCSRSLNFMAETAGRVCLQEERRQNYPWASLRTIQSGAGAGRRGRLSHPDLKYLFGRILLTQRQPGASYHQWSLCMWPQIIGR